MASLDQMEGDAIELALLALVIFIIIAIYLAWRGINNNPLKWLGELVKWLEQEFSNFLNWLKNLPSTNPGGGGKFNPFGVGQGTSSSPQVQDPNTLFQIPDQATYNNGLLPLMWQDATGGGTDTTDSGSGVGTSINGSAYFVQPIDGGS